MPKPNSTSFNALCFIRSLSIVAIIMLFAIQLSASPSADIIPPVLNCPGNITVQLLPGECESVINYNVSATDNLDPNPTITLINGLPSGASFPIGTTTIDYQAVDAAGNAASCAFNIIVNEYYHNSSFIDCQAIVNLSLDQNCEPYITPAYVLHGQYGCYDNFTVMVMDPSGQQIPQLIDGTYLGQTLTVMVTENTSGLSCTGNIYVYDHSTPFIACQDEAIYCYSGTSPAELEADGLLGYPTAYDNCDPNVNLTYTDVATPLSCEVPINGAYYLSKIERTWTATDAGGLSNSCVQTIYTRRSFVYEIDCPKNADNIKGPALNCTDDPTDLSITGQPTMNGIPVNDLNSCNLSASYTDSIAVICSGSYRIYRTWLMSDLCPDSDIIYNFPYSKGYIEKVQVLDFLDTTPVVFSCPDSLTTGTSSASCEGTITLPAVTYFDDCSGAIISTITPDGIVHNANGGQLLTNLQVGNYNVIYVAKDDCGNISTCVVPLKVNDYEPPTIQCVGNLTFSVSNTDANKICYQDLDLGSSDNCSDLTYQIRRTDAPYGSPYYQCIFYDCTDVGTSFQIEMIVTDAAGYDADCLVNITIIDDNAPDILCPADISINCQVDFTDLTITGNPSASDECAVNQFTHNDNIVIGTCGLDTIFRTWSITDQFGNTNSCIQQIVQINQNPFYITDTDASNADPNDGVEWPAHYNLLCSTGQTDISPNALPSAPVNYAEPKLHFGYCDAVSMSYVDTLITGSQTGCYTVERTWYVINWCEYEAANPSAGGWFEYVQHISLTDNTPPVFTNVCEDVTVCNYDASCGSTFAHLEVAATDNCSADADLYYFYTIDLYDDGTIDANGTASSIDDLYPLGKHKVTFDVNDGCGNIETCEYYLEIVDCVNPVALCKQNVVIQLDATGIYNLTSAELESGASSDNCSNYNELIFSFSNDPTEQTFSLTCGYIGTYNLELWVTDQYGNQDKCSTTISIEDPTNSCETIVVPPSRADISGYVQDEFGNMIKDVQMSLTNGMTDNTDIAGEYEFTNLPIGANYTVTPQKTNNLLNGVTTLDLVLISRHVLGIQPLSSPYKMIAADVNHSNSITTLDIVSLQRVILGIDQSYMNNTSWRFVDMDYVFPLPNNPFAYTFPEVISVNNLQADELAADFIAVKIGDVNGTAAPNLVNGAQQRNGTSTVLNVNNKILEKGEEHMIAIESKEMNATLGYQMTLELDQKNLEIIEVIPGELTGMDLNNFGLDQKGSGIITANWFSVDAMKTNKSKMLFNIKVRAKRSVELKEALKIATAPTIDMMIKQDGSDIIEIPIELSFTNETTVPVITTLANDPNPFSDQTTISFNVEQASPATLKVIDLNGRVILERNQNLQEGNNKWIIKQEELKETGIYYYQIQTATFTATEKMIFMK